MKGRRSFSLGGRSRTRLVPGVFFVVREIVFIEELLEFFFEGFGAVVFALVLDVGGGKI